MRNTPRQLKWWLILALFSLVLAACTAAVADDAGQEDQAAGSNVDAAEEELTPSPNEEARASADNEAELDSLDDSEEAGEVDALPTADSGETTSDSEVSQSGTDSESEAASEIETSSVDNAESSDSGSDETDSANEPSSDEEGADSTENSDSSGNILTIDNRTDLLLQVTAEWETDFNRHTVPYNEIVPILFRDAIRSLDQPTFVSAEDADDWLPEEDPIIAVQLKGETRAYPLRIMASHEIVNDEFGDMPIVITYCPLCNSALVFNSNFDGKALEFGTTGLLRNSDLIMYDRSSETLWQQFTGEGIVGEYAGERLEFLPSSIVSFADYRSAFPEGVVLSQDTGFGFSYNLSSYEAYDQIGADPYLFVDFDGEIQGKEIDRRLPSMERVVSVSLDGADLAYPVSILSEIGVINDTQASTDLVVFHTFGTTSAFYNPFAQRFDDVGATGVFSPILDGEKLTFSRDEDEIVDDQSGSTWNILGQAVDGPLDGQSLEPIVHGDHFWFSWAAFKPDTYIYEG